LAWRAQALKHKEMRWMAAGLAAGLEWELIGMHSFMLGKPKNK
jgi:hypothetical protein